MSNQERKLAAIVYTDIAGFSELSASDENLAIELVNTQSEIIQPLIETYNGTLHNKTGDGFLLSFPTATSAVEFSIDFQRAVKHIDGLNIRIGIHEGEITVQNDDIFGDDVNICARIEPHSPVGGIAISEKVKLELGSLPEYKTMFIGEPELKGIKQHVKIFCISSHGLVSTYKKFGDSVISEYARFFRLNILSLTGIILMVIGGTFWVWYGFGDIARGSENDLAGGIKKTIAVFNFVNLSGNEEGDFFCFGISEGIRSVLTGLARLDVKSRHASLNKNPEDLELDYFIEGSLSKMGEIRNINVSLVNAKSGSNMWTGQYEFVDKEIVEYQDTIINNILIELNINTSANTFISNEPPFKNASILRLLGKGIYHFDNENYSGALVSFDSVLVLDPENVVANFHKANTYYKLDNFNEAMKIYQEILSQSSDIEHVEWNWSLPERKNINQTFCSNFVMNSDEDIVVMLSRGKENSLLMGFNIALREIAWETPIPDRFLDKPVVLNNSIFLTSSRPGSEGKQLGEPALYAYDITTGGAIFEMAFPRDNNNEVVLIKILEEYNQIKDDNSSILLYINKLNDAGEKQRELVLIETTTRSVLWKQDVDWELGSRFDGLFLNSGDTELLVLIKENDIITINNKTGSQVWHKGFDPGYRHMVSWNQKILETNLYEEDKPYIALWDPVTQKEVWKYYNTNKRHLIGSKEIKQRMGKDVFLINFTNGALVAVNFDAGFLNLKRERWSLHVGKAEKIWFQKNVYNRVFCLTEEDTLYTIKLDDGKILNRIAFDGHDYNVFYDNSKNVMVLNNSSFLIGIDPKNGDQLWKIKDDKVNKVELIENTVLTIKIIVADKLMLINTYNRDNGNLMWAEKINISESLNYWGFLSSGCSMLGCVLCHQFKTNLQKDSDGSLFLFLHDEILKLGSIENKNRVVQKKDVRLQIAKTFTKNKQFDNAIEEYNLLISQHDQMNQYAYWALANLYQNDDDDKSAVKSLLKYYDLILPNSTAGLQTIQKLKILTGLKWEKNVYWNRFDTAEMAVDNEKAFLLLDNIVESYRISSGALLWKREIGDKNKSIVRADVTSEKYIYYIKRADPDKETVFTKTGWDFVSFDKARKYSLVAMGKRRGEIYWDDALKIPGESEIIWMAINNNKIFIQSITQNNMSILAHDLVSGDRIWEISRDISSHYATYDLQPAFYNDDLLLPLDTTIEYINSDNGVVSGQYSNEDIEQIFSFNSNSIQNNSMIFFTEDIDVEYVIVDLEKNVEVAVGEIDLEEPRLSSWINNIFIAVSSSGSVSAYGFQVEDRSVNTLWQENYNSSSSLLGVDKQNIYLLDMKNDLVVVADIQSGAIAKSIPVLWPGQRVEMINNYIIVQSASKLYLISI